MLHFASGLQNGGSSGVPRRTDSLNATQQKAAGSHPIFLAIEQELHDARRVGSHGQEDDLRAALNMVINRVTELSSLLSEAYKSKAELELQLNVTKSNLQLVIANNEMLEEALKSGGGRDVGWRRSSGVANTDRPASVASQSQHSPPGPPPGESPTEGSTPQHSRRPPQAQHLTSPSLPSLHQGGHEEDALSTALQAARASAEKARQDAERERQLAIRERKAADKARADAIAAARDKIALEAEIESLSQALFEEANTMVATERKRRAEVEGELEKLRPLAEELRKTKSALREDREELREAREEREALRSALRVIEGENVELRSASRLSMTHSSHSSLSLDQGELPERGRGMTRSRSSSEVGTKSPVHSPDASPTLPSAAPSPHLASAPSPRIPSASSSPHIPPASSPHIPPASSPALPSSSAPKADEEEDEEPITFLRPEAESDEEHDRPTPRRVPLAALPVLDPSLPVPDPHPHPHPDPGQELEGLRSSSPALSPPPTALAPAPHDPWGAP
ncbi:Sec2p domain-containing protein [Mycena sanguinolenta]|uniref:Sec2p domain-containing protein n=1 Tax=Mycena sanguinolenta TaxID=230812 RepID=A0A8H6ZD94_9AGAR|nr:Sec2p domain-containing protein [Mycena sanguinolenta]